MKINTDILRDIAVFLLNREEQNNEDWGDEIAELNKAIQYLDLRTGVLYMVSYDTILETCLEEMDEKDMYYRSLPLGYHIRFIFTDANRTKIVASFYDVEDNFIKRVLFWDLENQQRSREEFEYYLDHFYEQVL